MLTSLTAPDFTLSSASLLVLGAALVWAFWKLEQRLASLAVGRQLTLLSTKIALDERR
jgi:hypothetical protein